jgi:hypothetical protein
MAAILANTGSGNWNANGTWVGSVQPTAADDVTIPATATVTIPSGVTALARSVTVSTSGTLAFAATTSSLNIGDATAGTGNVAFSNAGTITLTAIGTISFKSTSTTQQTITSGGQTMPALTFNGSGGKWQLSDNLTMTGAAWQLSLGTIDTNNKTINCATCNWSGGTATLGSSAFTATATANVWRSTGSLTTFTANTATVTFSGTSTSTGTTTATANWNGTSFTFSGSGAVVVSWAAGSTCANLTRTGTAAKTDGISFTNDLIVTNTLTLGGNTTQGTNRLFVQSGVIGTQRTLTLTGGAVVISGDVNFIDIDIAGSPSWTNTGSKFVGDCGGNTSLITTNATAAATQTATGTASFTWSTHGWTSRVPLPQDTVLIPNAFVAGRTITLDMPQAGNSISFAGGSGSPTLSFNAGTTTYIFGSLTLVTGVTPSGTTTATLAGRSGSFTITSAGATWTNGFTINAPGSTYTLADNLITSRSATGALTLTLGTYADAGFTTSLSGTAGTFVMTGGTLTSSGAWSIVATSVGAATFWSVTGGTVTQTGTITLSTATSTNRTFAGGGNTYGTLTSTVAGSTGSLTITGANTFTAINFSDATNARTLTLPALTTTTIATGAGFNVNGTSGKPMTIQSSTGGTAATLSTVTGLVSVDFVSLQDSAASGNVPFYAGANSTNVSGNTSWNFTGPTRKGAFLPFFRKFAHA